MIGWKFTVSIMFLLFVSLAAVVAQDQGQQQQQGATLTREAVEKLLEVLSFECRSEMENALAQQTDVSMECKQEITQAIRTHDIPIQHAPLPDEYDMNEANEFEEAAKPKASRRSKTEPKLKVKKEAGGISPVYYILGFVVLFFGAVAAYIVYINQSRGPSVAQKPKKLSKKKEEKLKQKKQKLEQIN